MNSYNTIDEAREAARGNKAARYIIEIEPGVADVGKYVISKVGARELKTALNESPMREINNVIGSVVDLGAERIAKHNAAIPGLAELRAALRDRERHYEESQRRFDSEDGCCQPIRSVAADVDVLIVKYPVAAAYIKAERWSGANNYVKAAGTRRPMDSTLPVVQWTLRNELRVARISVQMAPREGVARR